jgi:hypothetical protein
VSQIPYPQGLIWLQLGLSGLFGCFNGQINPHALAAVKNETNHGERE